MLRKFIGKYGNVLSAIVLSVGVISSCNMCHFIYHQPEVPEKMKELVKARRNRG